MVKFRRRKPREEREMSLAQVTSDLASFGLKAEPMAELLSTEEAVVKPYMIQAWLDGTNTGYNHHEHYDLLVNLHYALSVLSDRFGTPEGVRVFFERKSSLGSSTLAVRFRNRQWANFNDEVEFTRQGVGIYGRP